MDVLHLGDQTRGRSQISLQDGVGFKPSPAAFMYPAHLSSPFPLPSPPPRPVPPFFPHVKSVVCVLYSTRSRSARVGA